MTWMTTGSRVCATVACLLLVGVQVCADSLYIPGRSRSMFADRKARAVGDIVTVLITESTVASQDAESDVKRKGEATANGGSGLFGLLKQVPRASLSGETSHKGSGSTTRSSRLTTTVPCRVVEVTTGGLLVLSGERSLTVNADTQTLKLTGLVRPDDIDPDNTVLSNAIADAKIAVVGKGPIGRQVKPGFLSRVFQFLF